jgi:hypothetical protein
MRIDGLIKKLEEIRIQLGDDVEVFYPCDSIHDEPNKITEVDWNCQYEAMVILR